MASAAYLTLCAVDLLYSELSLGPAYLLVVLYVSWTRGRFWGAAAALLCAGTDVAFGWTLTYHYTNPVFMYLNVLCRLLVYSATAWITAGRRARYDKGRKSARSDYLTGAANRLAFYEALRTERARQRRSGKPLSVVYIDCDNFKAVNDSRGHAEGDKVLRAIVSTARSKLRETDVIARHGGDEFALLLPETDRPGAAYVSRTVHDALNASMASGRWDVSFSIGVGTFVSIDESPEELVSISDGLMYEAKRRGKNALVHREYAGKQEAPAERAPA